jgi:hypothetical protein
VQLGQPQHEVGIAAREGGKLGCGQARHGGTWYGVDASSVRLLTPVGLRRKWLAWRIRAMRTSVDPDEAVVRKLFDLSSRGRQDEIVDLLHADAIVVPLLHRGLALNRSDFEIYAKERVTEASLREANATSVRAIGDGRFLVEGRVLWSLPGGGFSDRGAAWAVIVKDGAVYRLKGTHSVEAASVALFNDDWSPNEVIGA